LPDAIVGVPIIGDPKLNKCTGDERVNENPYLVALSGLFVQNHNYHAR
jgi:hypothetical protein